MPVILLRIIRIIRIIITIKALRETVKVLLPYKRPSNFKRSISDWRQLKPGDVIGVHKKPVKGINTYDHYGIYAGNFEVIHFSDGRKHFASKKVPVRKDPFSLFKGEASEVFVLDFDMFNECIKDPSLGQKVHDVIRRILGRSYYPYSPEETLRRAESQIGKNGFNGKDGYNVLWRNCEHFAIWCKTGIEESSQIENLKDLKLPTA